MIKQHLISPGIKNGRKDERVIFRSVELLAGEALHAEGFYQTTKGEEKAYFHISPNFHCSDKSGFTFQIPLNNGEYTKMLKVSQDKGGLKEHKSDVKRYSISNPHCTLHDI